MVNKRYRPSADEGPGVSLQSLLTSGSGPVETGPASTAANGQPLLWQFRWQKDGDAHGPFDSVSMQGWVMQGCFSEERPAEVRQCDAANKPKEECWHSWSSINFALYSE